MTAEDLIRQVQENASEWIDEIQDIHDKHWFVVNILAHKLSKSFEKIEYLENRLYNESKKEMLSNVNN